MYALSAKTAHTAGGGQHGQARRQGGDRHRREPRHRRGDRASCSRPRAGTWSAPPARCTRASTATRARSRHRRRHPRRGRRGDGRRRRHLGAGRSASGSSQSARETYGPIDVLVNNAALTYFIPIKDYPLEPLAALVGGELPRAVHPQPARARRHDRAQVAARSSTSRRGAAIGPGRGPYPDRRAARAAARCYGAEKAALERFTQGLAAEVYQYGVSRDLRLALAGRADGGHRAPQARRRAWTTRAASRPS